MIEVTLPAVGRVGTAVGPAFLHNQAETVSWVGKAFDPDGTYTLMLTDRDGDHIAEAVGCTVAANGTYVSGQLNLRVEETEAALGSLQEVQVKLWLYNDLTGNYDGHCVVQMRRSPLPSGAAVVSGVLPMRFLEVTALPASGRVDTVYWLPVTDGVNSAGWWLWDGVVWVQMAARP